MIGKKSKKNNESVITFLFLPAHLRLIAFLFGLLVIIVNVTDFKLSVLGLAILALGIFCFGLSLYDDTWNFDMGEKKVRRRRGFFLIPFYTEVDFEEVYAVVINEYERRLTKAQFSEIVVVLKNGKQVKLDYDKTDKIKDSIRDAGILQRYFSQIQAADIEHSLLEELDNSLDSANSTVAPDESENDSPVQMNEHTSEEHTDASTALDNINT